MLSLYASEIKDHRKLTNFHTRVLTLIKEKCKLLSCARDEIPPNIPHYSGWLYFIDCASMAAPSLYGNPNLLASLFFVLTPS